jgi:RHS repeat-associated protein
MKDSVSGNVKKYTYIGGDAYTAPVMAVTQNSTTNYYYLLRDYLGSITHVVNTSNSVVAEYSYDAWGRMRNPATWVTYAPGQEPELTFAGRGFTGHEHLRWFNLINMNGRMYDPLVGQFLSPDIFVQSPGFTQSFNRFSYCLNNPLKYSDPSGYIIKKPEKPLDPPLNYTVGSQFLPGMRVTTSANALDNAFYSSHIPIQNGYGSITWVNPNTIESWQNNGDLVNLMQDGVWNIDVLSTLDGFTVTDYSASDARGYIIETDNVWLAVASNQNSIMSFSVVYNPSGDGDGKTLEGLEKAVKIADYGVLAAEGAGYNATIGIWKNLTNIRYYASGWVKGNQYVLRPLEVAKVGGFALFTFETAIDITKFANGGQSGSKTFSNGAVNFAAWYFGGATGFAIKGSYEYGQYMWNCITGYGQSVNQLYQQTFQNYWKGTLEDPSYQP